MFSRRMRLDLIQVVLPVICLFLLIPVSFYNGPGVGLDPSYCIANYLAFKFHLVFGKDFVFTFGPLGILYSRLPIGIPLAVYLLFDLYFLITSFFVLKHIFRTHPGPGALLYVLLALILNIGASYDTWYIVYIIFYVLAFTRDTPKPLFLFQAGLLSILCFYCKLNLGIVAILVFIGGLCYVMVSRKLSIRSGLFILGGYFLAIGLSALALHVYLPGYIRGSLHLIDAYNDAMFSEEDYAGRYLTVALIVAAVFAGLVIYRIVRVLGRKDRNDLPAGLFAGGLTSMVVFTLFKTSFVRADLPHMAQIFRGVVLLSGLLYLYSRGGVDRLVLGAGCWVVMFLCVAGLQNPDVPFLGWRRLADGAVLRDKAGMTMGYFRQIGQYGNALQASARLSTTDNALRRVVGNATIDILPTEISTIYFNGLHYDPRPVVQSYSAYDGYLDSLNYQKYMSATAPDYVLFSMSTVDGRQPFFDEPRTKLALLGRYRLAGRIGDDLLLKKREGASRLRMLPGFDTIPGRVNQDIDVPDGPGLQYAKFTLRYNTRGKIRRFLYHPPRLHLAITLEDGEVKEFRGVKPLMEDGVLLNKDIESTEDFQLLALSAGKLSPQVRKIRLITDSAQHGFDSSFQVIISHYSFVDQGPEQILADRIGLAEILAGYARYRPRLVDTGSFVPDHFAMRVDHLQQHSRLLRIEGWGFREQPNNTKNKATVVFSSVSGTYELPTTVVRKSEMNALFNRNDLDSCGFIALADRTQFLPGSYRVGLLIRDSVDHRQWIHYDPYLSVVISAERIEKTDVQHLGKLSKGKLDNSVEEIESRNDQLVISGWAYVEKAGSGMIPANVLLRSGTTVYRIPAAVTPRADLADYFKDPAASYAGWSIRLPADSLPPGNYTVGIEKRDSLRHLHTIAFTDKMITLSVAGAISRVGQGRLPKEARLRVHMEHFKDNAESAVITGWVAAKADTIRAGRFCILLKNNSAVYSMDANHVPRPDVAAAFKPARLEGAGFNVNIPKTGLPPGRYAVGVAIYQDHDHGVVSWTDQVIEAE